MEATETIVTIPEYPKIKRIPIPGFNTPERKTMTVEEAKILFDGNMVVTEKMDGKSLSKFHGCMTVFYEDMRYTHTVFYDELPGYNIAFDVWDDCVNKFLPYWEAMDFAVNLGYRPVPFLYENGMTYEAFLIQLPKFLDRVSSYSSVFAAEGVVVKRYDKSLPNGMLAGKVVAPKFEEGIVEHWTKRPLRRNLLYALKKKV